MRYVFLTALFFSSLTGVSDFVWADDPFELAHASSSSRHALERESKLGGEIVGVDNRELCVAEAPFCVSIKNVQVDETLIAEQGFQSVYDRMYGDKAPPSMNGFLLELGSLIVRLRQNEKTRFDNLYNLCAGGRAIFTLGRFENEVRLTVFAPQGAEFSFTGLLDGDYIRAAEASEHFRVHVIQLSRFEIGPELGVMLSSLPENSRIIGTLGFHAVLTI